MRSIGAKENENGKQREIITVLSDELAPRMPELALRHQVWALRTAAAEKVAQRFWKEHPPLGGEAGSGGITLFAGEGDPDKDFAAILNGVELHHGLASSERPAVSVHRVLGTVTYLHHDQAGSTRLLTGVAGLQSGEMISAHRHLPAMSRRLSFWSERMRSPKAWARWTWEAGRRASIFKVYRRTLRLP